MATIQHNLARSLPAGVDARSRRQLHVVPLMIISSLPDGIQPRYEEINQEALESLGETGCTWGEIEAITGVDEKTILAAYPALHAVVESSRAGMKRSLRRRQIDLALQDDDRKAAVTAAIWLGKNYLGQSDRMDSRSLSVSVQVDGGERALSLADPSRTAQVAALLKATLQPGEIDAHSSTLLLADPSQEGGPHTHPLVTLDGQLMPPDGQPTNGVGHPPASAAIQATGSAYVPSAQPENKGSKPSKGKQRSRSAQATQAKTDCADSSHSQSNYLVPGQK